MTDVMVRAEPKSRTRRRRARRTKRVLLRTILLGVLAAGAVTAGLVWATSTPEEVAPPPVFADQGDQFTVLVPMSLAGDASGQADTITLFGVDQMGSEPVAMFIPTGTFGQIPGQSSIEQIGKALTLGRDELQRTAVENLLGIAIDRTVVLDDVTLARAVEAVGGLEIEVVERLYETTEDGRQELVFPLGRSIMTGPEAVTFLTYRAPGASELDRFPRAQAFWEALLAKDVPSYETLFVDAGLSPLVAGDLGVMLDVLAAATPEERSYDVLAVRSVGAASVDDVFELDEGAAPAQITRLFGGSVPSLVTERGSRPRVELRNGVGVPEAGAVIAARLVPEGFKIEVTGNAEFGNAVTRIIVYGEDDAALELAELVKRLLGAGEIEVGTRGQTVVDLTIVIGEDLVRGKA